MARKFQKKDNKKGKKFLFEDVLNVLKENPSRAMNYKQVAAAIQIEDQSQKLLINALLADFVEKGLAVESERGKFKIKSANKFITGKVDMTASGSAYIVSEESEEDIYISQQKTGGAMNGDVVKVRIFPARR